MVIRNIMDEDFDRFLSNVEKSLPSDNPTLRPNNVIGYVIAHLRLPVVAP